MRFFANGADKTKQVKVISDSLDEVKYSINLSDGIIDERSFLKKQ